MWKTASVRRLDQAIRVLVVVTWLVTATGHPSASAVTLFQEETPTPVAPEATETVTPDETGATPVATEAPPGEGDALPTATPDSLIPTSPVVTETQDPAPTEAVLPMPAASPSQEAPDPFAPPRPAPDTFGLNAAAPPPTKTVQLADFIPAGLATVAASRGQEGEERAALSREGAAVFFGEQRVLLVAQPGAFPKDIELVIKARPVTLASAADTASTAGDALKPTELVSTTEGYQRLLPFEQSPVQFELEALGADDGQPLKGFEGAVQLYVDLRGLKDVAATGRFYAAWRDPDDPTLWHRVETVTYDPDGVLGFSTDHFSSWVAGSEPGAWHFKWNQPTVSTYSGAATYDYPIEVPPGVGGLAPNIDLSYSSRGVDGLILPNQDQGPLGLGWSMSNIEISRSRVETSDDGAHVWVNYPNNYSLVLNGAGYNLRLEANKVLSATANDAWQSFQRGYYLPSDGLLPGDSASLRFKVDGVNTSGNQFVLSLESITSSSVRFGLYARNGAIVFQYNTGSGWIETCTLGSTLYPDTWYVATLAIGADNKARAEVWPEIDSRQRQVCYQPGMPSATWRFKAWNWPRNYPLYLDDYNESTGFRDNFDTPSPPTTNWILSSYQASAFTDPTSWRYYADSGPQLFVQEVFAQDFSSGVINRDKLYWVVKDAAGTTYVLGYTADALSGQTANPNLLTDAGPAGADTAYSGMRWRVSYARDLYGNQLSYTYTSWTEQNTYYSGAGNGTTVTSELRRPADIFYNYDTGGNFRSRIQFIGAGDNKRVRQIRLYHTDTGLPYRLIDFDLDSVSYATCGQTTRTDRVKAIRQFDGVGTVALPATTFSYGTYVHAWGDCYKYDYISQVENGYGGKVAFTYQDDGRWDPDWNQAPIPSLGRSLFVTHTDTWAEGGGSAAGTDYAYSQPCYDQNNGHLGSLPGASQCLAHDWAIDGGPLSGFAVVTTTVRDYGGAVVNQTVTTFWQNDSDPAYPPYHFLGRPKQVRVLDAGGVEKQRTDSTYASPLYHSSFFTYLASEVATRYENGQSRSRITEYVYATSEQGWDQFGNLTHVYERGDNGQHYRLTYRTYHPNWASWIVGKVGRESVYACSGGCGTASQTWVNVRTTWHSYDNHPLYYAGIDGRGELTAVRQAVAPDYNGWSATFQDVVYTYDAYGNRVTEATYAGFGAPSQYASADPRVTTTTIDSTYHLYPTQVTNPMGHVTQVTSWDYVKAKPLTVRDPNNVDTHYRYDAFGRLVKVIRPGDNDAAPTVSTSYSDDDQSPTVVNPLTIGNNGFETGADWFEADPNGAVSFSYDTSQAYSGSRSLKIITTGTADHWIGHQNVTGWQAGKSYWLSAWVKTTSAGSFCLNVSGRDGHEASAGCLWATTAWQRVQGLVSLPADATRFLILLRTGSTGTVFVDQVTANEGLSVAAMAFPLRVHTESLEVAGQASAVLTGDEYVDGLGRTLQTRAEADGGQQSVVNTVYDGLGRTKAVYVPTFETATTSYSRPGGWDARPKTTTSYDALSRVTAITNPDGTYSTRWFGINSDGYYEDIYDAKGHVSSLFYDVLGRATHSVQYTASNNWERTIDYSYTVLDQLERVYDSTGLTTTITYDFLGQKTAINDPDMGYWTYAYYDGTGQLKRQTDARGQRICFYYDRLNRLTGKHYRSDDNCPTSNPSLNVSYTYDAGTYGIGRRTGMTDASGSTAWAYDWRGRPTQETKTITGAGTFVTQYGGYDPMDRLGWMKYPGGNAGQIGEQVFFNYTAGGQPRQVYNASGTYFAQDSSYDAAGRLDWRGFGWNGSVNTLILDLIYNAWTTQGGRLQQMKAGTPGSPTSLQDLRYTYDAVGNVLTIQDWKAGSPQTQTFTYDYLDRLKTAGAAGGTGGTYTTETYTYTLTGNLIGKAAMNLVYPAAAPGGCTSGTQASKPHALDYTAGGSPNLDYGYDCNGNVTTRAVGGTAYTLSYDAENRLTGVSGGATASFVYDGDGNRVKATVGVTTTVYIGNYYEFEPGSNKYKKYYYAGGGRVAMNDNGTLYWLLGDHLGSTSLTANFTTGALVAEVRYKPWGENRYTSPAATPTTYRFTGQRQEAGLGGIDGLYYYGARWYDPYSGRFVAADTIVPEPGNPQSLNRYSYSLSNPLKYTDPSGHWVESAIDLAFLAYDIWDISQNGLNWETGLSLAADVGGLLLPAVTGGGAAVRAAFHADDVAKVVTHADDAAKVLGAADNAADALKGASNAVDSLVDAANAACSFSGDTLVSTAEGYRPINSLEPGDVVLAYHDGLSATGFYTVTATWTHLDLVVEYVTIDGEIVETTPDHPFFTAERGWTVAGDLWLGAHIADANGRYGIVQSLFVVFQSRLMHNLTVADAHTFFVGEQQWLVHNACPVFRVEGTPNTRLSISPDGNVRITGNQMLFLNFGDAGRAAEFYLKRLSQGMPGVNLKAFLAEDELLEMTQASQVPQVFGRLFPNAPQIVDAGVAANQFGYPSSWFDIIESKIIPGTGQILR